MVRWDGWKVWIYGSEDKMEGAGMLCKSQEGAKCKMEVDQDDFIDGVVTR